VREPRISRLEGPKAARQGAIFVISGAAQDGLRGRFSVDVHWNARPWRTIAAGSLGAGGSYRAEIPLSRKGMLNIRIVLPNGDQVRGSLRVLAR